MKAIAVLVIVTVLVLLVVSSMGLAVKIGQRIEEKPLVTGDKTKMPIGDDPSVAIDGTQTSSAKSPCSDGNLVGGSSGSANDAAPGGALVETPHGQSVAQTLENNATSVSVPAPDGRIYLGGEEPFAYTPTYSPKTEKLPVVPLTG